MTGGISLATSQAISIQYVPKQNILLPLFFLLSGFSFSFLYFAKQLFLVSLIYAASYVNIASLQIPSKDWKQLQWLPVEAMPSVSFSPLFKFVKSWWRTMASAQQHFCALSQSRCPNCKQLHARLVRMKNQVTHSQNWRAIFFEITNVSIIFSSM